jgi:competence protein ComEC
MVANVVLFVLGVTLLQWQASLPSVLWSYALAPLILIWILLSVQSKGRHSHRARIWIAFTCLAGGFLWAALVAHVKLADYLPEQWEGREIQLVGVIAELPQVSERSVRFQFDVERVETALARVPARISLNWYAQGQGAAASSVHAGERWRLWVRLRRPHGLANPNGFDFEVWLLERGIRATGYVRDGGQPSDNRLLDPFVRSPRYVIERAREAIRDRILHALPGDPNAGVLVALAIGDQQAISREQWRVFTRTGVNHLISISGLHITMVASLGFGLVLWLWRRSPRLTAKLPAVKAAALAGFAIAWGYALLAGFAVPAQRTVFMLAAVAAALLLGLAAAPTAVLATALFVAVVADPLCVLAPGFWLSFGAVGVIMYVTLGRIGQPHWLVNWARVQWAVTIGLMPVLIALFQQVSIVSPFANAVAIPVVSLAVVPATLVGVVLPVDWGLWLAATLMSWCTQALAWLSSLPSAVWQQHAPPVWSLPLALAGAAWLLAPRGIPARWVGLVAFLPLLVVSGDWPLKGEVWVDVLDVGQGLSALVRTEHHALLYDAGPAFSADSDAGNRVVVPFLRAQDVRRLDVLIVTHDDSDHSGGARSVLEAVPVALIRTSLSTGLSETGWSTASERCEAGQRWEWDGVRFVILHPPSDSYNFRGVKDNARSCVLKVESAFGSMLFPADIEQDSELQLQERELATLRASVLLAPHHGSSTSSTAAFLAAVAPELIVIPVGYRNRFGHPKPDVMARYHAMGSRVLRTDRDGAVSVRLTAAGLAAQGYREQQRRYWQE